MDMVQLSKVPYLHHVITTWLSLMTTEQTLSADENCELLLKALEKASKWIIR